MEKQELLKLFEVAEEIGVPVSTVQKHVRDGRLRATKNGREYMVIRKDLNKYLGIENNDDLLKKDLEIAQLNLKIKSYEMQIRMINSFVNQVKIIVG